MLINTYTFVNACINILQKGIFFFYSDCKHESNRSFKFKLSELIMYWKTCSNNSPDVLRLL